MNWDEHSSESERLAGEGETASSRRDGVGISHPEMSPKKAAAPGDRSATVAGDLIGATVIVGDHSKITIGKDANRMTAEARPRPLILLSRSLAAIAIGLAIDVLRQFLGGDGGWSDTISGSLQAVVVTLITIAVVLTTLSLIRPASPLVKSAARFEVVKEIQKARRAVILTGIAGIIAFGLWLSLPAFAPYYNVRGVEFQYSDPGNLSRARESYRQAIRLKPHYAQAHYNLATTYEDFQPDQAIAEYLLAIKYDSQMYPAYNNLARLYILKGKDGDYEQALNILHQALDTSPPDTSVQYSLYKNIGWANYLHSTRPNYLQAEQNLRMAISLRKDKAAAHCLLAYVLKKLGKAGAADECFDCVTLAPGEKDVEAKWVSDAQECLMKGNSK
jgi:tetratricopeptide (TPR) repeat protein